MVRGRHHSGGSGNEVRRLRRRLGQGIGLRFILPVGAGQPLAVLPQVLLPGGHDKDLHKTVGSLPVPEEPPLRGPGPQP